MVYFPYFAQQLANGGALLLSGLLQDDKGMLFSTYAHEYFLAFTANATVGG